MCDAAWNEGRATLRLSTQLCLKPVGEFGEVEIHCSNWIGIAYSLLCKIILFNLPATGKSCPGA